MTRSQGKTLVILPVVVLGIQLAILERVLSEGARIEDRLDSLQGSASLTMGDVDTIRHDVTAMKTVVWTIHDLVKAAGH